MTSLPQKTQSPKEWRDKPSHRLFKFGREKQIKSLSGAAPQPKIKIVFSNLASKIFSKITAKIISMAKYIRYTRSSRKRGKPIFKKILSYGLLALLILFLLLSITCAAAIAWFSRDLPNPDKLLDRQIAQSTKIYDRTGQTVLYEIYSEKKRTLVELSDIPEGVKKATIVAEDRDFYKHYGFDLKGIIRSVWKNLIHGEKVGGSTITQQFIKNSILSPEKTYTRKLKELALSIQIERKFTKDQILKMYFNEIPYGSTAYGIQSAAQTYFGKNAKDLDSAEGALLAALPKAPTYYSPYGSHTDDLLARQQYILDGMAELGYIGKDEAEKAKEIDILKKIIPKREAITAPHFVMYVKEILTQKYGEKTVEQGGLKVYTTLDLDKQKAAEEAVTEGAEKNTKKYNATNAALVALDPKTGQILAMVGSKDYFDTEHDGNVNVSLRPRQPGSSFKPIVYATAFEKGYTPETTLFDLVTTFKTETRDYIPHNYDGKERGPVSIRQALAGSLNISAVKTLYLAGVDNVLNQAEKMGYTTFGDRSRFGLSLVLGGGEVKLLEHTAAFGVFATEGKLHPTTTILKVEDAKGQILEEWKQDEGKEVLSAQTAKQIANIMSDDAARAYIFGAKGPLTLPDRPVAAKTGTTNDWRDGWTIGYTPSLAAGVWAGNNDNQEMKRGSDGVYVAAPIWNAFMKKVLEGTPAENFTPPDPSSAAKPVLKGEVGPETIVRIDKLSGKLATEFTPPTYIEEKKFREVHTILFYVQKDDPNGPPPENPEGDPQFATWEAPIQKWAEEQGYTVEKIPAESDDIHLPELKPTVSILSPENNATLNSRDMTAAVSVSAPRGPISRVEYFVDGQLLKASYAYPYSLYALIPNAISNGFHALRATAYDDIDNFNSTEITFNLLAPKLPPQINWLSPRDGASFYPSNFPLTINVETPDLTDITEITFYARGSGEPELLKTYSSPTESTFTFKWDSSSASGDYKLYAQITDKDENTTKSREISVTIL